MDDSNHVIWQSSQTKCEALNVLMSKAQRPISNRTLVKADLEYESFNSPFLSCPPSSSSLSGTFNRPRKSKRRKSLLSDTESDAHLTDSSVIGLSFPKSQLASPSKLVNLIRNASLKIDESSEMQRRLIERARLKARRKESERRRKKEPNTPRSTSISKEELFEKIRRRESEAARSFKASKSKGNDDARGGSRSTASDSSNMYVNDDSARMPPPQHIPARLIPALPDENLRTNRVRDGEHASSSSSTQTVSFETSGSSSALSPFLTNVSMVNASTRRSSACNSAMVDVSVPQKRSAQAISEHAPEPVLCPSQSSQKAKTRVLGMRRYATTPSNSERTSSDTPLPTKQKQFKPPLVRHSATRLANIQAAVLATAEASSVQEIAASKIRSEFQPARNSGSLQSSATPSTGSESKANDSFDSMDIDMDELWSACSAYD